MSRLSMLSLLLISLLLVSGCQSAPQVQYVPVECPPPPAPPAWMMVPEPEQTYTQQLLQVLSE